MFQIARLLIILVCGKGNDVQYQASEQVEASRQGHRVAHCGVDVSSWSSKSTPALLCVLFLLVRMVSFLEELWGREGLSDWS